MIAIGAVVWVVDALEEHELKLSSLMAPTTTG